MVVTFGMISIPSSETQILGQHTKRGRVGISLLRWYNVIVTWLRVSIIFADHLENALPNDDASESLFFSAGTTW